MQITVESFGIVRSVLGERKQQVELNDGATVRDAVEKLLEKGGARARRLIVSPDGKSLKVLVMVSGQSVVQDAVLQDGAEISLMLTIGGGA